MKKSPRLAQIHQIPGLRSRFSAAFTLIELLVVISIIGILAALALPAITGALVRGQETQTLSNMKQLHLATQQMALDATTTGDTNIGWPGDLDSSFNSWATNLTGGNYLTTNDLCKLVSAAGKITPPGVVPSGNNNAVLVYAATENCDSGTVFLSTANFTNSDSGGAAPSSDAKPYGSKGFVVFHRGGDGVILASRQTGSSYTNIIGAYVPPCN